MQTFNQFDRMANPHPGQTFDLDKYPDLTVPDRQPSLQELVDRSAVLDGNTLPGVGTGRYSGEDPLLNLDFKTRRDKLAVSNHVKDIIHDAEQAKPIIENLKKEAKAKKAEQAKIKAAEEEEQRFAERLKKEQQKPS